jgi:pimeloyl-ACP methyl ester carboxylesterase
MIGRVWGILCLWLMFISAQAQPQTPPAPAYTPQFRQQPCLFDLPEPTITCGVLRVPENRADPTGRQVELAVTILPALLEPKLPDPVIYLEGGPGYAATYRLYTWVDHPLRAHRDFVLMDQRGTGFSTPSLNCPEIEQGSSAQFSNPLAHCEFNRRQEDRIDLDQYHSAASAADFRDLAQAMGYQQINLYGISYGTRLALTIIRDYPQLVRSAVLDAVFPPEADLISDRIYNRFRAFEALFDACQSAPACRQRHPNLEATFYDVVARYNDTPYEIGPVPFSIQPPSPLDGNAIVDGLFQGLYNTPALAMIPAGIARLDRAESRDDVIMGYYMIRGLITPETYRNLGTLPPQPTIRNSVNVRAYENRAGDVTYAEGMYLSVNCAEEIPFSDENAATDADAEIVPEILFDYLVLDVRRLMFSCSTWGVSRRDRIETERVTSDIPILLTGGAYDPITAVSWMMSARSGLPNSRLVIFTYGGHGVSIDTPCGVGLVVAHINAPNLQPDTSCAVGDIPFFIAE